MEHMDTIAMPRPVGRPKTTLAQRVEALMAKASPAEVAQFQSEAHYMLASQPAPDEDACPIEWAPTAQNPKLQTLMPICDAAMARMLSRVDGTWMVRCWVRDPHYLEDKQRVGPTAGGR